jgi:septal ring factor EnvC (AmiA/AmiB activator)
VGVSLKKGPKMRWVTYGLVLCVLCFGGMARAQEVKPEDQTKKLEELEKVLKDAQDRRADLARENQKLTAQIAELKKETDAQAAQIKDLQHQAADFADRTLFLGSHYEAWKQFIAANPEIRTQWELFIKLAGMGAGPRSLLFLDPNWPLSEEQ